MSLDLDVLFQSLNHSLLRLLAFRESLELPHSPCVSCSYMSVSVREYVCGGGQSQCFCLLHSVLNHEIYVMTLWLANFKPPLI
jgi:hypothetical protein